MRLRKLIISTILIILITSSFIIAQASDLREERDWTGWVTEENKLVDNAVKTADSAIVVDINSGRIIYGKTAYNHRYPASTTKIMTCMLALENSQLTDMVTVDDAMWNYIKDLDKDSTMINVKKGEALSMKDLVYGLMLESGNDAAVVIACHVGGTYDNFISMMNAKAQEIGMDKTHYANPHGLTEETHQTTARDMALLAMYTKENYPVFEEIVSTYIYSPADTNVQSHSTTGYQYSNSNKLIIEGQQFFYPYATGIKTGYTLAAENVLVSSAKYENQSLVAVVMKDTKDGKWTNSTTLFDYAIDFYETIKLSELFADKEFTATVENADMNTTGNQLNISIGQGEEVYLTEPNHTIESILADKEVYFTEDFKYNSDVLTAPISAGDQIGTVTYKYNYSHNTDDYLGYKTGGQDVKYFEYTAPLYAVNSINEMIVVTPEPTASPVPTKPPGDNFFTDRSLWEIALIAIGVLFVILVILLIIFAANKGGPNKRYPNGGAGRHSHDDRGNSRNRRRY